jgi:hypothetical protein
MTVNKVRKRSVAAPKSVALQPENTKSFPGTRCWELRLAELANGTVTAASAVVREDGSGDSGTPLVFGLLLGGLAAAIFLLLLAVLPPTAAPRLVGWRADRRLDMAIAGALALLVVTVVYLVSVS